MSEFLTDIIAGSTSRASSPGVSSSQSLELGSSVQFSPQDGAALELWQQWRAGEPPDLASFLAAHPDLGTAQRVSVIRVDQRERWRTGERVPAEDYLALQPELALQSEAFQVVYGEFVLREQLGESPTLEEYVGRFPQFTEPLQQQADMYREMAAHSWFNLDSDAGEADEVRRPASRASNRPATRALPRPTVAGYAILSELGRGGMGVVYKAQDVRLKRVVALKMVLAGDHAGKKKLDRFRGEAEAVAAVQHPNIVQVYEVGEHNGLPYLALEYLDGGSLSQRLDGKPMAPRQAAEFVEALAQATHHAHQQGIIHRDLKPSNVLLTKSGIPKITDFGLAKSLDNPEQRTITGDIVGTPSYMAPEQATGVAEDIGPSVDVYALGAILYELLTGRPPFHGPTPVDTIMQVRFDEPVSVTRLQPRVPRDLETICLKCLQKEPRKRYASGKSLAADLRRFLGEEPIKARPVGTGERLVKWAKRRPAVAALTGLVVLFGLIGFLGITYQWREAVVARQEEVEQRTKADVARLEAERALYFSRIRLAEREWLGNNVLNAEKLLQECLPRDGRPDLRGWEWYYLRRQCRTESLTIAAGREAVMSIAYRPSGRQLVSASGILDGLISGARPHMEQGQLAVWDLATGRLAATLLGHTGSIWAVAYSPDGRRIASAGTDGTVRIWDAETFQQVAQLEELSSYLVALAFTADGKMLATGGYDRTLRLYDIEAQKLIRSWAGQQPVYGGLAFTPDGKRLVCAGVDKAVKLWNVVTGAHERTIEWGPVSGVAISPDGRLLAAPRGNAIYLFDLNKSNELEPLRGHAEDVLAIAFGPDGRRLASGGRDLTIHVWDVQQAQSLFVLRGHTVGPGIQSLAFSSDGDRLASAGHDALIKIWDVTRDPQNLALKRESNGEFVTNFAFSPDERHLLKLRQVQQMASFIARYDIVSGAPTGETRVPLTTRFFAPRGDSAFYLDGRRLLGPTHDNPRLATVLDTATGQPILTLRGHNLPVRAVAASADGSMLATAAWLIKDGQQTAPCELHLWDGANGQLVKSLQPFPMHCLAFNATGDRLAAGGLDDQVYVWDVATGNQVFRSHDATVTPLCVAFSPTEPLLVATSFHDRALTIWDLSVGLEARRLRGHTDPVCSAAFSPDGHRLASIGYDGTVRLWDVTSGMEVTSLASLGRQRAVNYAFTPRVLFSKEGDRILANSWTGALTVWDGNDSATARGGVSSASARLAWHEREVETKLDDGDAFAAMFHLNRLLAAMPNSAKVLLLRAQLRVQRQQWDEAAADFAAVFAAEPPAKPAPWLSYASVLLRQGELARVVELRQRMWQRFHAADDGEAAPYLGLLCVLAPLETNLRGPVADYLERELKRQPNNGVILRCQGALSFRAGDYAAALPKLEEALRLSSVGGTPTDWLFVAMTLHRLGKPAEARAWLAKAEEYHARFANHPSPEPRPPPPLDWLEGAALLPEVREVFKEAGP